MLNTSSDTPPASSRSRLVSPPDFSCHTRPSGSRTACWKACRRRRTCSSLVTRVACQRPIRCVAVPMMLTLTMPMAIAVSSAVRSSCAADGAKRVITPGSG